MVERVLDLPEHLRRAGAQVVDRTFRHDCEITVWRDPVAGLMAVAIYHLMWQATPHAGSCQCVNRSVKGAVFLSYFAQDSVA